MKLSKLGKYIIVFLLVLVFVNELNLTVTRASPPPKEESPQISPPSNPSKSMPLYQVPSWARMVNINTVNPNIRLDIRYATTNNFGSSRVVMTN